MNLNDCLYLRNMKSAIAYLNSNDGSGLIALGAKKKLRIDSGKALSDIQQFIDGHKSDYIFVMLSYELKNEIAGLTSSNTNGISFPIAMLWIPDTVVKVKGGSHEVLCGNIEPAEVEFIVKSDKAKQNFQGIHLLPRTSRQDYLKKLKSLKKEIQFGNIYEVNYCQEFFAENVLIEDSLALYHKLNNVTSAPFSAFVEVDEFSVMCGSPERFIRKVGSKLTSQPIKGTIRRGGNLKEDEKLKEKLLNDPKERAENVMIVDLVRNDLSRIATKASVQVEELFGIYTFKTVHQMISTISCEADDQHNFCEILKATFPMGSMTGAPKISAMKLIERHEDFQRGLYSGSIGYIDPNGDFDLNVVIRSLIYNKQKEYLSCSVGSAITIQSEPEAEYEECFTKIRSILDGINA